MTYNDREHARLPNSLPVVGRDLAERLIAERELERPGRDRCWPARGPVGPNPNHKYVRALFAVVNAGGTLTAVLVCGYCGYGRRSVPYKALAEHAIQPSDLPLLADYRRDYCERCGALGAQLHHMAPQALFPDADDWPLAYLCQSCHALWHATVNGPGLQVAS
jgi:hypothetical protein